MFYLLYYIRYILYYMVYSILCPLVYVLNDIVIGEDYQGLYKGVDS